MSSYPTWVPEGGDDRSAMAQSRSDSFVDEAIRFIAEDVLSKAIAIFTAGPPPSWAHALEIHVDIGPCLAGRLGCQEAFTFKAKLPRRSAAFPAAEDTPGPGQFRCEMCGGVFDLGDDDEARAEAESQGIDPDASGLVCDECYLKTPWGGGPELSDV